MMKFSTFTRDHCWRLIIVLPGAFIFVASGILPDSIFVLLSLVGIGCWWLFALLFALLND